MTEKTYVDEYLAKMQPEARKSLQKLREDIREAAPDATEGKSYGMPAFFTDGPLVAFRASKGHCSFFPMSPEVIAAHADELAKYQTSKGTIRFETGATLSAALVRKIVKARVKERAQKKRDKEKK